MVERKYSSFVRECTSGWSQKANHFAIIYSAGGVVEEAYELIEAISKPKKKFREKVISEMGDMVWYMTAFMISVGRTDDEIISILSHDKTRYDMNVLTEAIPLHKKISKHIFYNESLDGCEVLIATIISKLKFICEDMIGVKLEVVMEENIKKIDMRYPKGRNTEHVVKSVDDEISKMEINGRN